MITAAVSTTTVVSASATAKTTEIDRIVSEGVHAGPFVIVVTLCVCFFLLSFTALSYMQLTRKVQSVK